MLGAEAASTGITDIIVTAQKRSTRLQETPIAVTAVGSDLVDRANLNRGEELVKFVPNLQFREDASAGQRNFVIRGIGTGTNSVGVEGSVGIIIDNVVLGREGMGVSGFDDIERIEVLRGPQGTLFGKNASAGVIQITTKQPNLDRFTGGVRATYGNYNAYRISGNMTGPVAENLALYVSAFTDKTDGYLRNVLTDKRINGYEKYGVRLKSLFRPSESFEIKLASDYSYQTSVCCEWALSKIVPGTVHDVLLRHTGIITPGPNSRQTTASPDMSEKIEQFGFSGEMTLSIGDHSVTSITAYRKWDQSDLLVPDHLPTIIQNLDLSINARKQHQFSQELRLTSPSGRAINYVFGLFYFDQKVKQVTDRTGFGLYRVGPTGDTIVTIAPDNRNVGSRSISEDRTRTYAAFGDATLAISDKLKALLGFRYSYEEKDDDFRRFITPGLVGPHPGFPVGGFSVRNIKDDKLTYRMGLQYQWTTDIMTYVTYSTGHKGKGVELNPGVVLAVGGVPLPTSSFVVKPEDVKNLEGGLRSTLFDRKVQLNVSAFATTFKNYQGTAFIPASVTFALQSVKEIKNDGIEIEAIISPVPNLRLMANGAYINSRYTDFSNAACYPGQTAAQGCAGGIQDLAGERVPRSPKYSFNVGMSYEPSITDTINTSFLVNYSWRDKVTFASDNDPELRINGFGLLDLSAGLKTADGKYEINVWGKNVLDKDYRTYMFTQLGGPGNYNHFIGAPATYGVSLGAKF